MNALIPGKLYRCLVARPIYERWESDFGDFGELVNPAGWLRPGDLFCVIPLRVIEGCLLVTVLGPSVLGVVWAENFEAGITCDVASHESEG